MLYTKGEYVRFKGRSAKRKADEFEIEFRERCERTDNSFLMTRETRTRIDNSPLLGGTVPLPSSSIEFTGHNGRTDAYRK